MQNLRPDCLAMLLAGGEGKRLSPLTEERAKPAIPFGIKYRIIDFSLSNCTNSGIKTIGVLVQHKPHTITAYVGDGNSWNSGRQATEGKIAVLAPAKRGKGQKIYRGTADAVFQNMAFVDLHRPRLILVIAGDHIYQMDYRELIDYHTEQEAEITIASTKVPWEETCRFGILSTTGNGRVIEFHEKPDTAPNNLASMGIYLFNPEILKKYLWQDQNNPQSSNDFGKDIIPLMLRDNRRIFAYPFRGYWMDVGTVSCFWKANMELLQHSPRLELDNPDRPVYTAGIKRYLRYTASETKIRRSMVGGGCLVSGEIDHSILFSGVDLEKSSTIRDSIIMSGVKIGENTSIRKAIIDRNSIVGNNCRICPSSDQEEDILLIKENSVIPDNSIIHTTGIKATGHLQELLRRAAKGGDTCESAVCRF